MELKIPETDLKYICHAIEKDLPSFRRKRFFITGGTGFIGKWILETLCFLDKTHALSLSIVVLSRDPDKFKQLYPQFNHLTYIKGDIRTFNFPDIDFDFVIHAATEASASLNINDPLTMSDVICDGTKRVLQLAAKNPNCQMLFLSSGAVYGEMSPSIGAFKEDFQGGPNPLLPGSAYGESKRLAELYCATYARNGNVNVKIARCFAFVGPYLSLDTHYAIGNFIGNGLKNEPIVINGNGSPLRSYLYASDLIIWLLTILTKGKNGEAYNVGSDEAVSIRQLAETVADFFPGLEVKILNQIRVTDRNQDYIPDISKIRTELGVSIGVSLKDAIYKTIQFHRQ